MTEKAVALAGRGQTMTEKAPVVDLLRQRVHETKAADRASIRKRLPAPMRRIGRPLLRMYRRWRMREIEVAARTLGATRIIRTVDAYRGEFELDMRSHITQHIALDGFELSFVPLFESILESGADFIDVGANAGLYTVLGGKLVGVGGRVLAVEPAPSILPLLRANIARNALENVTIFEGVASSQRGTCSFNTIEGNEEYSSLGTIVHPSAPHQRQRTFEVATETLDHLVEAQGLRPRLIKIDTEGAEGLVLRGARGTLQVHRPVIVSELDHRLLQQSGDTADAIRDILVDLRYTTFNADTGIELPRSASWGAFTGEIVAVPSEQVGG